MNRALEESQDQAKDTQNYDELLECTLIIHFFYLPYLKIIVHIMKGFIRRGDTESTSVAMCARLDNLHTLPHAKTV